MSFMGAALESLVDKGVRVSCLGGVTPGVKDTPFLGSARGTKEAEDLLTRSEFVGGERAGK